MRFALPLGLLFVAVHADFADRDGPGEPLYLTPLIKSGKVEAAKKLSSVPPFGDDQLRSFSGYLTVNETNNSNMFFWFFPALVSAQTKCE